MNDAKVLTSRRGQSWSGKGNDKRLVSFYQRRRLQSKLEVRHHLDSQLPHAGVAEWVCYKRMNKLFELNRSSRIPQSHRS